MSCSCNTLSLVSCRILSFLLFVNMYIIDITIGVTVTDSNRVTTHAYAIAVPSDEVLECN